MANEPESTGPTREHSRWRFDNVWVYLGSAVLLLAFGGVVFGVLVATKPEPTREKTVEPSPIVRVFEAQKTAHRISVTAYGTSRASEVYTAIAEIKGRAVEVNERFEEGEILPAGTVVARIDPTDYQLTVMRLMSEATARIAQIEELDQTAANLRTIFGFQQRHTQLAQIDLEREQRLRQQGAGTPHAVERAEQAFVTSSTSLQSTKNGLALIPTQRALAQASLDGVLSQLDQAYRDLDRCEIRLPLDARCASKSIERDQFVTAGQQLGSFLDIKTAEVAVMLEMRKAPILFPHGIDLTDSANGVTNGEAAKLSTDDLIRMNLDASVFERIRVPVEISWGPRQRKWTWLGRVTRVSGTLDPNTQMLRVIVEVSRPYEGVQPGLRPALLPDAFCRATVYGATVDDVVVIPRTALRDDQVYLLREGRLEIAQVDVLAREEDRAVIGSGIEPGDRVILSDLPLASPGMRLRGKVEENPVGPCQETFPASLFETGDETDGGLPEGWPGQSAAVPREPVETPGASLRSATGHPTSGHPASIDTEAAR